MTIGTFAQTLILKGLKDEQILARIAKKFPAAKTTKKCLAWYRNDMRKKGLLEPVVRKAKPAPAAPAKELPVRRIRRAKVKPATV